MMFLKEIKMEGWGYNKSIIMVEMPVGMRKLGSQWTHRLESSSKDALAWVTCNEGSEGHLTVRAIGLSLSHYVSTLWYFEFRRSCSQAEVATSVRTACSILLVFLCEETRNYFVRQRMNEIG
jgi:hypothetical protein